MRTISIAILIGSAFAAGFLSGVEGNSIPTNKVGNEVSEKLPLYWVAPMDPNYRRDKPGKSPMGMELVPVYENSNSAGNDGGVQINSVVRNNIGVRTELVARGPVTIPIRTVGYVTDDEEQLVHVHSRISGWVEELHGRSLGDKVQKGEPLYGIYSPDLVNAQREFLMSERLRRNSEGAPVGGKLRAMGMTADQIAHLRKTREVRRRITVFAPVSGYLASLPVRSGMYVQPDTEIMAIESRASVWVIAEFFERQAGLVEVGQLVTFTTASSPGVQWQGTIDYVYPELDAQSRTLRARVRVPNPSGQLRPNMFVNLTLQAPIGDNLLTIPRQALIQSSGSQHVLVARGDGYFLPVPVVTGQEAGNRIVVRNGLEEGAAVVVSAQFLIDSETNLEAALSRLDASRSGLNETSQIDSPSRLIEASGQIKDLDAINGSIVLKHEPIPELDWPEMTMAFDLASSVDTDGLIVDQPVKFYFRKKPEGFLIENLESKIDE